MTDMTALIKRSLSHFSKRPLLFLSLQMPMFVLTFADFFFSDWMEDHVPLWGLVVFVFFGTGWSLSSALTFVSMQRQRSGLPDSLLDSARGLGPHLISLLIATVCANALIFVGILALLFPGIWALVSFVYVPWVVVAYPPAGVQETLRRSSRLVKEKGFPYYLVLLSTYFLFVFIGTWALKATGSAVHLSRGGIVMLLICTLFSATASAWFDIMLSNIVLDRAPTAPGMELNGL